MKSIICNCLEGISPPILIQRLSAITSDKSFEIYPIWLNNRGQNVIGFLPNTAFSLAFQDSKLVFKKLTRKSVTLTKNDYCQQVENNATLLKLQNEVIAYQKKQASQSCCVNDHYDNGLMGFVSYDISAQTLGKASLSNNYLSQNQPLAYFGHYDIYLTFKNNQWQLHTTTNEAVEKLEAVEDWLNTTIKIAIRRQPSHLILSPIWTKTDYAEAFNKVQNCLTAGDCYQINLTQCWQGELNNHRLVDYLPQLHQATNAPFAGYLELGKYELLSCSPELFLTFSKNDNGEHTIITKPIKGTRPRGKTDEQDNANQQALADSDKDKAENVMIVDLLRNDLGKYAKTGSVNVPKLFGIESFSNVHHMVSTITATLKDDVHPLTVLFDSLPAGSITGAPKKRAVEIIHELEAKPRGAYCGTMGYLNFDGTGQWNVLIRTLQAKYETNQPAQVSLWAGGGITIASECEAEYQECLDKVGNLIKVLQDEH